MIFTLNQKINVRKVQITLFLFQLCHQHPPLSHDWKFYLHRWVRKSQQNHQLGQRARFANYWVGTSVNLRRQNSCRCNIWTCFSANAKEDRNVFKVPPDRTGSRTSGFCCRKRNRLRTEKNVLFSGLSGRIQPGSKLLPDVTETNHVMTPFTKSKLI